MGHAWIASSRGVQSLDAKSEPSSSDLANGARQGKCYAQVYLDNSLMYSGRGDLFDINTIPTSSIEAIEYYAGPSEIPAQYLRLNSPCGVVVIHTRR